MVMIDIRDYEDFGSRDPIYVLCDICGRLHLTHVKNIRRMSIDLGKKIFNKTCSRGCQGINRRTLERHKKCLECGRDFILIRSERRKFCSKSCAAKHSNRKRIRITKEEWQARKKEKERRKQERAKDLEYKRLEKKKSLEQKRLEQEKRAQKRRLEQKKRREERRRKVCEECGIVFVMTRDGHRKTCTKDCRRKLQSRIKKERLERLGKRELTRLLKMGRHGGGYGIPTMAKCGILCRSKVEAKFLDFLTNLKIKFQYEPPIPKTLKIADILIKNDNWRNGLYIEMDGLCRDTKNTGFGWDGKLEHYKWLLEKEIISGYLVVTPSDYKEAFLEAWQSGNAPAC